MTRLLAATLTLAVSISFVAALWAWAEAQPYTDGATSSWFKSLQSQHVKNCCDQADCKKTRAEWRGSPAIVDETGKLVPGDGAWWALSNVTREWVEIRPDQITREADGVTVQHSIFDQAILCEGPDGNFDGTKVTPRVYCFAPPPFGF